MAKYTVVMQAPARPGKDEESVDAADYTVEDGFVHFTAADGSKVLSVPASRIFTIKKG